MSSFYDSRHGDFRTIETDTHKNAFPFRINEVGTDYCNKDYILTRNNSPLYVIGYTVQGAGILFENEKKYHITKDQIFIIHKGKNHTYYSEDNWGFCWFNIYGDFDKFLNIYNLNNQTIFFYPPLMEKFIQTINYCIKAPKGLYDAQLTAQSFVLSLLPKLKDSIFYDDNKESKIETKLKIILEKECFKEYSFENICTNLGISERHAQRLFKESYGITPHEYVLQIRFEQACSLLMHPSRTITEISESLGFSDEKYFSNFFKTRSGFSPNVYRKLVKK